MADFTQLHHKRRLVRSLPSPALRRSIREDAGLNSMTGTPNGLRVDPETGEVLDDVDAPVSS